MEESSIKGNSTELSSMAYLQKLGGGISIPFGNLRYDFILDYHNVLYKVQVKSCKYLEHTDAIYMYLTSGNSKRVKKYEDHEVDFFCTFYDNQCYLIPKKNLTTKAFTLRLSEPKNKQEKGVHLAKDYLAEKILG